MREKRILIFESYYEAIGGNQRYITYLFKYRKELGYKVILGCPDQGIFTKLVQAEGGETHIFKAPRKLLQYGGSISRAPFAEKFIISVLLFMYNIHAVLLLRRIKPSVVLCNNIRSLLMIGLATKLCDVPTVWFVKGELNNPILDKLGFKLATKVIFLSKSLMHPHYKRIFKKDPQKFCFVKIGIELDAARKAKKAMPNEITPGFPRDRNAINFACASYLCPNKGIEYLVDAFYLLAKKHSNVKLYIIGDTIRKDYMYSLQDRVRSKGIDGLVHFTGWTDTIHEVLEAIDVYVLPSLTEGVPRSIVEAMSQGKPILATRVGGIPELLGEGKFGLLVPPRDTPGLLEGMERLATDPLLREKLGQTAREEVFSHYSIHTHVQNLSKVFDQVVSSS